MNELRAAVAALQEELSSDKPRFSWQKLLPLLLKVIELVLKELGKDGTPPAE